MSARGHAPRPRLAIVLHGKVGDIASVLPNATGKALRAFDNAQASPHMAALCAVSLLRYVITPNLATMQVDVIGHSWSPEIGATLDGLYNPLRSLHEPQLRLCPAEGLFFGRYCIRTYSHMLGVTRAMRLKRQEERSGGFSYDAVFLSRWDTLWRMPFHLPSLPGWVPPGRERRQLSVSARNGSRPRVWLPRICAPVLSGAVGVRLRTDVCGGKPSLWSAPQTAIECSPGARACAADMQYECAPRRLAAGRVQQADGWPLAGHCPT